MRVLLKHRGCCAGRRGPADSADTPGPPQGAHSLTGEAHAPTHTGNKNTVPGAGLRSPALEKTASSEGEGSQQARGASRHPGGAWWQVPEAHCLHPCFLQLEVSSSLQPSKSTLVPASAMNGSCLRSNHDTKAEWGQGTRSRAQPRKRLWGPISDRASEARGHTWPGQVMSTSRPMPRPPILARSLLKTGSYPPTRGVSRLCE